MKVKTFPLIMTEEEHKELQMAARKEGKSIKDYVKEAIETKKAKMEGKNGIN